MKTTDHDITKLSKFKTTCVFKRSIWFLHSVNLVMEECAYKMGENEVKMVLCSGELDGLVDKF